MMFVCVKCGISHFYAKRFDKKDRKRTFVCAKCGHIRRLNYREEIHASNEVFMLQEVESGRIQ